MTHLAIDRDDGVIGETRRAGATGATGAQEIAAAALLTLAAAFFWWRGFHTFTIAGAGLFVVALVRLAEHRRRFGARAPTIERARWRGWAVVTLIAVSGFPALLVGHWIGVTLPMGQETTASADLWLGAVLYVLGVMELVELATLRALDDSGDEPT